METSALAFGSLFLGLVVGSWPVDLLVSAPVAEVVVSLDGHAVARRREPPWRVQVDFGDELAPHRLEAVGLDSGGRQVARVGQRINMPRPAAELDLVLNRSTAGDITGATVRWQTATRARPRKIKAELDGAAIAVDPSGILLFPPLAPDSVHFLRVAIELDERTRASREVTFGADVSEVGGRVLTGLAVLSSDGRAPLASTVEPLVLAGGRRSKVIAVEEGPARLAAVFDPRVPRHLWWSVNPPDRSRARRLRGKDLLLLMSPVPTQQTLGPQHTHELFTASAVEGVALGPFLDGFVGMPEISSRAGSKLADAVASAAVLAAAESRRRGVLLVLGAADSGEEAARAATVRQFLRTLGVPLFVWSPLQGVVAATARPWGEVTDISTRSRYARARKHLTDALDRQHIAWIEGDWLPQEVVLEPGVTGLELAGRSQ